MRFAFFLLTIVVAAGAIWASDVLNAAETREQRQVVVSRALAENGIRRMLWHSEAYNFFDIVIGEKTEVGDLAFRGMVTQDGSASLVYGHARPTCDAPLDDPACWTVSHLEIDGRRAVADGRSSQ